MGVKVVDLSQPFGRNTPLWPHPGVMQDVEIRRVAYSGRDKKRLTTLLTLKMHTATHMDAEVHVNPKGWSIDKTPLANCYGTGVVLDMRHKKKWEEITPEDLEKARPKIEPGDWVVINTGWHHKWKTSNYEYFNHYPGLYRKAAEWLVAKKVKGVAGTWGAIDCALGHYPLSQTMPWLYEEYVQETGKDPGVEYPELEPAHSILYGAGILGIENAGGDIDEVTGMRCTIAAFPLRYEEGDGSMVRLVAIVEE